MDILAISDTESSVESKWTRQWVGAYVSGVSADDSDNDVGDEIVSYEVVVGMLDILNR